MHMTTRGSRMGEERYFANPWLESEQNLTLTLLTDSEREEIQQASLRLAQTAWDSRQAQVKGAGVYVGLAGVVWVKLQQEGCTPEESANLALELEQALASCDPPPNRRLTLLEGIAGTLCILAACHEQAGQTSQAQSIASRVLAISEEVLQSTQGNELFYGRAGYLACILFLRDVLQLATLGETIIDNVAREIVKESLDSCHLQWPWHGKVYLGAAHGVCGILSVLMRCGVVCAGMEATIDWLLDEMCFPSGNLRSSVSSTRDRLVQWCHGAPGLMMLLCEALKVFPSKRAKYLDGLRRSADVVWTRGLLSKGPGLCHGWSGNGMAMLAAYQATSEPLFLVRAQRYALALARAKESFFSMPDRPASLFEGAAGACMFCADVLNPDSVSKVRLFM